MDVAVRPRRTAPRRLSGGRDAERVVANAASLVEVRGDVETVVSAATYVEDHGVTPFDALHLVESNGDTIATSDETYQSFPPVCDPKSPDEGSLRNH